LRISPFDRLAYFPHQALAISLFQLGRHQEAANAARRAAESNPDFAGSHMLLAAALAKLGRAEAAKAAAMHVLALQPSFSAREFCAAVGFAPALAEPLTDAWRQAGLP
jgi:adenylate cyclase